MVMHIVYVLKDKNGKTYKGLTSDIQRRLKEHKLGNTRTTSLLDLESIEIVYTESCPSLKDARIREKYLKSSAGRRFKKSCSGSSDG